MKEGIINLTSDQLSFLEFLNHNIPHNSEKRLRYEKCKSSLAKQIGDLRNGDAEAMKCHHSPKRMIEFLSLFSRDDDFKWYTHKWDMSVPFDINWAVERQNITKSTLRDFAYPKVLGPSINMSTYNQVWNFINFLNSADKVYTWTNNKFEYIHTGWHSIIDLSKQKPTIPVESLNLPDGHQFRDYIRMFKAVIEFRTDLNNEDRFSELFWKFITSSLPKDFDIRFSPAFDEIGYNVNVYCDVVGLLSALNIICSWITKHKAISSEVMVDLISSDDSYMLEITHIGSYFNNTEKLKHPSGDLANLRKRLFSVCDFLMEGDLINNGHQHRSIIANILDNGTFQLDGRLNDCVVTTQDTHVGGVKYKLIIYRKQ